MAIICKRFADPGQYFEKGRIQIRPLKRGLNNQIKLSEIRILYIFFNNLQKVKFIWLLDWTLILHPDQLQPVPQPCVVHYIFRFFKGYPQQRVWKSHLFLNFLSEGQKTTVGGDIQFTPLIYTNALRVIPCQLSQKKAMLDGTISDFDEIWYIN